MSEVQRSYVVEEGWYEDESGLPVFVADSAESIDQELADLRGLEGANKLKMAAVLTEASDRRFYGEGTLQRVCETNQIDYTRGRHMVAGYNRLRAVEIAQRCAIVSAIQSGELYWSKAEIAAPVDDDEKYASLMNQAANGDLSASKMRKRVKQITSGVDQKEVEAELEGALKIVSLERAATMEVVVRWSDGTVNVVPKSRVLEEAHFTRCSHCEGLGVVEKRRKS